MSRFGTYLGSGVTVRYDFVTTGKKNIYYARFLFIYFEQTVKKKIPSGCENTTYYYMLYKICFVFIVSVTLHK